MTLHLTADRRLVRAEARSTRYLRVQFAAPQAVARAVRLPLDIALVIDKSGSMSGQRIALAKEAARKAVHLLGPDDFVALVAFDSGVEVLAEGALLTADHRRRLLQGVDGLEAGSSTNLSGGWLRGCEEVAASGREDSIARTLLLSDGCANVGITAAEELAVHSAALRARGVVTSTFGVGAEFDERLMEVMAREGGGNFYCLERPEQIPDFLMSELGEALEVVARDAVLTVQLDEGMTLHSMDQRRVTHHGSTVDIALNDLVSREQGDVLVRVTFPLGEVGTGVGLRVRLHDREGVLGAITASYQWEYAAHSANNHQRRDHSVDLAVATSYAARARREATELNRAGALGDAAQVLRATARRISEYAQSDPEMLKLIAELEMLAERHGNRLDAMDLKRERFMAYNLMEKKDMAGQRRRVLGLEDG